MKKLRSRIFIIGAGAAGLSCASHLTQAGFDVEIFEARSRIGGRAYSVPERDTAVEYGAEFIHGAQPALLDLLKSHGASFYDVADHHLLLRRGKLYEAPEFWEDLDKVMKELKSDRKTDRSVTDFVTAQKARWSEDILVMFKSYVEGYQAANLDDAGEKGLAQAESEDDPELNGKSLFRPLRGYSHAMELLFEDADLKKSQLHLQMQATELICDTDKLILKGQDLKTGKSFKRSCDFAVLTLPINVLKTGFHVTPRLPAYEKSVQSIPMGHVQRLTFEFTEAFWENLSEDPIGFFHTSTAEYFPTWWSQAPLRNRLLTAWQGGPKAFAMSSWSLVKKQDAALKTLSLITGRSRRYLEARLKNTFTHDWTQDPWSQGAYSYPGIEVPGANIRKMFDRFVVAGEATAPGSAQATVHGAILSGERAAQQIIRAALKKR